MSELNGMSCADFGEVAAELALGVLTGRERAQAIEHLDHCDSCREHVRQLSLTGEEMLGLLPDREPPQGFESRVMDQLGLAQKKRPRWTRRMLTVAAVSFAVVACGLGGWGLRGAFSSPSSGQDQLSSAALVTASHETAGEIFLYNGNPRWLYMSVDTDGQDGNGTVICQLEASGGRIITIGSFRLDGGYGAWGSPEPMAAGSITGARLTSLDGTVLATARFTATTYK